MKTVKRITALALVAVLAFCLTSCLALDDAKAHHMIYNDGKNEIVFNGKTYKCAHLKRTRYAAEWSNSMNLTTEYLLLNYGYEYRVTEADVPVLLSDRLGARAAYDPRLDVICDYDLYFPEDKYDEYYKKFSDPEFTRLTCIVDEFDYENGSYDELRESRDSFLKLKPLPDAVSSELLPRITGNAELKEPEIDLKNSGAYVVSLYLTNDDISVVSQNVIEIYMYEGKYYLDAYVPYEYTDITNGIVYELSEKASDALDDYLEQNRDQLREFDDTVIYPSR